MDKFLYWLVVLMAVVKITVPLPFIPSSTALWTALVIVVLILVLIKDKMLRFSPTLSLFIAVAFMGLIVKNPPSYFRPYSRLIAFIINIVFLSPLLTTPTLFEIRERLFHYTLIGIRLIVVGSFIAYLLGINFAQRSESDLYYWAFSGITNQSMCLAPCCAISIIEASWNLFYNKLQTREKVMWFVMLVTAVWCEVAAGSRGSLIGCICSIIVLVYFSDYNQKLLIRGLFVVLIAVIVVPGETVNRALYTINRKQASAHRKKSLTSSRDEKWQARWTEFTEDPILGVGFGSQTHYTSDDSENYIKATGGLEPGSSWLCVLSMTGFLGFAAIIAFNGQLCLGLFRKIRDGDNSMIFFLACLTFFFMHGFVEGWMLYSGNFIFFLYWIMTGSIDSRINRSDESQYECLETTD